jgi:ATP-dependent RNA helicase DDX55/SPB4
MWWLRFDIIGKLTLRALQLTTSQAPTGSGKTHAYLLPLCTKILREEEPTKRHHVASIVITPTRELAAQVFGFLNSLLAFHQPSAEILPYLKDDERRPATTEPVVVPQLVVGGSVKPAEDLSFFIRHSPNILVATPGRLAELVSQNLVNVTGSFQTLVLDEADRLLDLGYAKDLDRILAYLPKQRRTGLFSASMTDALESVIKVSLRNPRRVVVRVKSLKNGSVVEEKKTPLSLTLSYLILPAEHKIPGVMQLLEKIEPRPQRSIIFMATCYSVKYFATILPSVLPPGYSILALHGKMQPGARDKAYYRFVSSTSPSVLLSMSPLMVCIYAHKLTKTVQQRT